MNASRPRRRLIAFVAGGTLVLLGILILASSGDGTAPQDDAAGETTIVADVPDTVDRPVVDLVDPDSVYDPVRAGEAVPSSFRQLLSRDQIAPIYDPNFTTADDVDWNPDILIVGVEGAATAKAYPVSHLNRHEMVIDYIDGDPILVTW